MHICTVLPGFPHEKTSIQILFVLKPGYNVTARYFHLLYYTSLVFSNHIVR